MSELEIADLVIAKNSAFMRKGVAFLLFAATSAIAFSSTVSIPLSKTDMTPSNNSFIYDNVS